MDINWRYCAGGFLAAYSLGLLYLRGDEVLAVEGASASSGSSAIAVAVINAPGVDTERENAARLLNRRSRDVATLPDTVGGLIDAIAALEAAGEKSPRAYEKLLRQLISRDPEQGVGVVLDLLGGPLISQSSFCDRLLKDQQDDRIYPKVRELVTRLDDSGLRVGAVHKGYYTIAARHGGKDAADFLMRRVADGEEQAAEAVAFVTDHSSRAEFLRLASGEDYTAAFVIDSIASWRDEGTTARMTLMAQEAVRPRKMRCKLARAVGENLKPEAVGTFLTTMGQGASDDDVVAALSGVYGIGAGPGFPTEEALATAKKMVFTGLASNEHRLRTSALGVLSDHGEFRSPEAVDALERMLQGSLDDSERWAIRYLLARMKKALGD